jgi:DNA-binding NtrC family response regulator
MASPEASGSARVPSRPLVARSPRGGAPGGWGRSGTIPRLVLMMGERIKVLLVEDDGDSRELLAELLEPDFDVITAADGLAGLEAFEADHPDVVITDESLPGMCGTALAQEVKTRQPKAGVVLVSGFTDVDAGCCDVVLRKPINVERLSAVVGSLGEAARH